MTTLALLHQKGDLSYEKDHEHNSSGGSLSDRMPLDKHAKQSLSKNQDEKLKAINNTHEEEEVIHFDSDSTNLCIDNPFNTVVD